VSEVNPDAALVAVLRPFVRARPLRASNLQHSSPRTTGLDRPGIVGRVRHRPYPGHGSHRDDDHSDGTRYR
jgi:hypothetical protein